MSTLCKRHARAAVALFFAAILLTGFFTMDGYGRTWDDMGEIGILRMTLREYDLLLPFDSPFGEALERMGVERISESVEKDHGSCLFYPLFWAVCRDDLSERELTQIWRCYIWCLFTLGLFALYAVARRMGFSRLFGLTGVLILLLSPRFFAEGHYNNKDITLMTLVLVLMWQSARLMEKQGVGRAAAFAFSAGVCAAMRVVGAAYVCLFGLMIVANLWRSSRLNARVLLLGAGAALASLGFYVLLTPSFLSDPAGFIKYLFENAVGFSRWHGDLLCLGETISTVFSRPPFYYLPVFIAVTTPLWALGLLGVGAGSRLCAVKRLRSEGFHTCENALRTTAFLSWVLPLAACMLLRVLVYNGWRHVYFLYGPMTLCMLCGLETLLRFASRVRNGGKLVAFGAALCLTVTGIGIAANHPYQYAYFNALVPANERYKQFDMDWWNLSCTNALEELLEKTQGDIAVTASDSRTMSGVVMASNYLGDERVTVYGLDRAQEADYLIANLSYAYMEDFVPDEGAEICVAVQSYGSAVTVVYRLKGGETL